MFSTYPFAWLMKKGYMQGVFWMIMINIVSASNDLFMRFTGLQLHWIEVLFFRYLFGVLIVLPFMMRDTSLFKTSQFQGHAIRAVVGTVGLSACCYSVIHLPFSVNETVMFTQPFIFLILAYFFLKEHVTKHRWLATAIGFSGLMFIIRPGSNVFHWITLIPVLAATSFALLDLFATKMIKQDRDITLMFYFAVGTTLCTILPLFFVWQTPNLTQLCQLFFLGLGGNLIQFCIYRAFSATEASALMPFRYTSLIIASFAEYMFFKVAPTQNVLIGAVVIIGAALYMAAQEKRQEVNDQTQTDLKAA